MQFSTWSFAKLAVVLGVAGLLLGAAGSFLIAPMYLSKATVQIEPASAQANDLIQQLETLVLSRSSLAGIIMRPDLRLYVHELKTRPLEDVIEEMHNDIRIDPVGQPVSGFTISFQYPDRAKAQGTVRALMNRLSEVSRNTQRALTLGAGRKDLEVIDTPNLPVRPFFPDPRIVMWSGVFFGLSIAVGLRKLRKKRFLSWGFAVSALVLGFAGNIAGTVASLWDRMNDGHNANLVGNQYLSTALMRLENSTPEEISAMTLEALSRTSLSSVINDPRLMLYRDELKRAPLEEVVRTMQRHLSIARLGDDRTSIAISFEYGDRYKAQQATQAIISLLGERSRQLRKEGGLPDRPASEIVSGQLTFVDEPSLPVLPVSPDRYAIAGIGGAAGLFLAGVIAIIRNRWRPEGDIPMDAVNG
jgi:hypothetical protein